MSDCESGPLRAAAVERGDTTAFLALKREHTRAMRPRIYGSAAVALAVITVAVIGAGAAPTWATWVGVWALFSALGAAGGRKDSPLIGRAVLAPHVTKLDSDTVLRALGALGIAEINKALASSALKEKFAAIGAEPAIGTPEQVSEQGPEHMHSMSASNAFCSCPAQNGGSVDCQALPQILPQGEQLG